jgi:hypothetical protein
MGNLQTLTSKINDTKVLYSQFPPERKIENYFTIVGTTKFKLAQKLSQKYNNENKQAYIDYGIIFSSDSNNLLNVAKSNTLLTRETLTLALDDINKTITDVSNAIRDGALEKYTDCSTVTSSCPSMIMVNLSMANSVAQSYISSNNFVDADKYLTYIAQGIAVTLIDPPNANKLYPNPGSNPITQDQRYAQLDTRYREYIAAGLLFNISIGQLGGYRKEVNIQRGGRGHNCGPSCPIHKYVQHYLNNQH